MIRHHFHEVDLVKTVNHKPPQTIYNRCSPLENQKSTHLQALEDSLKLEFNSTNEIHSRVIEGRGEAAIVGGEASSSTLSIFHSMVLRRFSLFKIKK